MSDKKLLEKTAALASTEANGCESLEQLRAERDLLRLRVQELERDRDSYLEALKKYLKHDGVPDEDMEFVLKIVSYKNEDWVSSEAILEELERLESA